jgi:hypothetical protein
LPGLFPLARSDPKTMHAKPAKSGTYCFDGTRGMALITAA